jgi:hypothetical protein
MQLIMIICMSSIASSSLAKCAASSLLACTCKIDAREVQQLFEI